MKRKDSILLLMLLSLSSMIIVFSNKTQNGALEGLILAQETIVPSLLSVLIIFYIIMKTGAKNVLAKWFGIVSVKLFNLPKSTFPAIFLGLIGGYPTGALLTQELLVNDEIDDAQARKMLKFNFCGGCGFIITAVGFSHFGSTRIGIVLFLSNVISSVIIGILLSMFEKKGDNDFLPYQNGLPLGDAIVQSVESAMKCILSITAFIVLFSAFKGVFKIPSWLMPVVEISNGICAQNSFSLALTSAYLSFGGLCIHLQLLPVISKCKMKYFDFLFYRVLSALISYAVTEILLLFFPFEISVFSNQSQTIAKISSVNITLSILMILGCFVLVLDLSSKKKYC